MAAVPWLWTLPATRSCPSGDGFGGGELAFDVDAEPLAGADELDAPGVHAADGSDVEGGQAA